MPGYVGVAPGTTTLFIPTNQPFAGTQFRFGDHPDPCGPDNVWPYITPPFWPNKGPSGSYPGYPSGGSYPGPVTASQTPPNYLPPLISRPPFRHPNTTVFPESGTVRPPFPSPQTTIYPGGEITHPPFRPPNVSVTPSPLPPRPVFPTQNATLTPTIPIPPPRTPLSPLSPYGPSNDSSRPPSPAPPTEIRPAPIPTNTNTVPPLNVTIPSVNRFLIPYGSEIELKGIENHKKWLIGLSLIGFGVGIYLTKRRLDY